MSEALKVLIYKAYYASNKVLTLASGSYFIASSTATAVATVAPTIGLLPSKEKLIFESFWGSKNPQPLILRALRQKFRFADIFRYEKICAKSAVFFANYEDKWGPNHILQVLFPQYRFCHLLNWLSNIYIHYYTYFFAYSQGVKANIFCSSPAYFSYTTWHLINCLSSSIITKSVYNI